MTSIPVIENGKINPVFIFANRNLIKKNNLLLENSSVNREKIYQLWLSDYKAILNLDKMLIEFMNDRDRIKFLLQFN